MTPIVIVGEAWGENEAREQTAFVGAAGYHLTKMLSEAQIDRANCYLTNVFNLRPDYNKIETLCGGKTTAINGYPALIKGKFIRAEFRPELDRLGDELIDHNPNIVICLGNTALWALTGLTAISKHRGSTLLSTHTVEGFKVLPTYHPAAVMRQWELRPTTVIDLMKAKRESAYAEIRRPAREIWIEPTLDDLERFYERHLKEASRISVDIETAGAQVTCIGFSPTSDLALVVPFHDRRRKDGNYWPTLEDERAAWGFVRRVLDRPTPKVFQNGLYDIAFLWRSVGIKVRAATHDTMLLHHALQPESLKSLGFLGSIYTDEGSWKQMRKRTSTIKRDE